MKVFAFYSFKGGVGRTALMMHLAVQWADNGKVVAVVDMDLDAPGVSYSSLLRKHPDKKLQNRGVSDLLATFYSMLNLDEETFGFYPPTPLLREMNSPESGGRWGSQGRLLVLPAGSVSLPQDERFEDATGHKIPSMEKSPDDTQTQKALREFARMFLQDMQAFRMEDRGIDYLLIDCRTGYPDVVDLAMGYMADRIVLVSGLNQQNLEGLKLTLKTLRPKRIKPGYFASQALVVFSPVPAHVHDQPEACKAIQAGITILEDSRISLGEATQAELIPPVFALSYTPHLASSDMPIPRKYLLGKLHPYWEVVNEIAENLDPQERVIPSVEPTHSTTRESATPPPTKQTLAPMLHLPKWHWPMAGDQEAITAWLAKLPINRKQESMREEFLDGLCGTTTIKITEKKQILQRWSGFSAFRFKTMLEKFQTETRQLAAMDANQGNEILPELFNHQLAWAQELLGEEKGRKAMLHWPLEGRGVFSNWEEHPKYWALIIEKLPNSETLQPFNPHPFCQLAFLDTRAEATLEEAESVLDAILAHSLPEDSFDCYDIAELFLKRWPQLTAKVEIIITHLRKKAEKDSTGVLWCNLGTLLDNLPNRHQEAEYAYRQAIQLDPEWSVPLNNLGVLYYNHFKQCQEALKYYSQGLQIDPDDPYLRMNQGSLRLQLGQAWRKDLEAALNGFEKETDLYANIYQLRLTILLGLQDHPNHEKKLSTALLRWPMNGTLRATAELLKKTLGKNAQADWEQAASLITSHFEYRNLLKTFHLIAGARPDLREGARQAAAFFYHLPPERLARFSGIPNPEFLQKFLPFIQGESDGAGDIRERHLFCKDFQAQAGS